VVHIHHGLFVCRRKEHENIFSGNDGDYILLGVGIVSLLFVWVRWLWIWHRVPIENSMKALSVSWELKGWQGMFKLQVSFLKICLLFWKIPCWNRATPSPWNGTITIQCSTSDRVAIDYPSIFTSVTWISPVASEIWAAPILLCSESHSQCRVMAAMSGSWAKHSLHRLLLVPQHNCHAVRRTSHR